MSNVWLVAGLVTLTGHGALAGWLAQRDPVHHQVKKTVVRFKVMPPVVKKEVEPPPPRPVEPPPPPPPKLVKRIRPKVPPPTEARPEGPTKTDIVEPAASGLADDQSAAQGRMMVQGGGGIDGAVQKGKGAEKTPALPPPPRPSRKFVPIFEVTKLPRAIRPVQPEVPDEFRSANREAVVVVEVSISANGRVVDARVIKKAGFGLDQAAIDAARRTAFEPAMQGDRPVAVKMQIPYRFKVRG